MRRNKQQTKPLPVWSVTLGNGVECVIYRGDDLGKAVGIYDSEQSAMQASLSDSRRVALYRDDRLHKEFNRV